MYPGRVFDVGGAVSDADGGRQECLVQRHVRGAGARDGGGREVRAGLFASGVYIRREQTEYRGAPRGEGARRDGGASSATFLVSATWA